jgi:hypothetical protein
MADNRVLYFGGDVRCIGEWRFEGGGFVQILVGGSAIETAKAIEWAERLIEIKKSELATIAAAPLVPGETASDA